MRQIESNSTSTDVPMALHTQSYCSTFPGYGSPHRNYANTNYKKRKHANLNAFLKIIIYVKINVGVHTILFYFYLLRTCVPYRYARKGLNSTLNSNNITSGR